MAQETTFGCGQFLPGYGPGNFPDFEGGGTVDEGTGGGDPPPEEECECIIDVIGIESLKTILLRMSI